MLSIKTIGTAVVGAAAIGLSLGSMAPAEAASFGFSYTFLSGQTVSGTVDGDLQANNNTVSNLSNLSATYSGQPGTLLSFLPSSGLPNFFTLSGSPFQFFGFANDPDTPTPQPNFGFGLGSPFFGNGATVGTFQTIAGGIDFPFGADAQEAEQFSAARWTASQSTPIPTPALLPGLIGMGVAAWRKRKNEESEQVAETAEV